MLAVDKLFIQTHVVLCSARPGQTFKACFDILHIGTHFGMLGPLTHRLSEAPRPISSLDVIADLIIQSDCGSGLIKSNDS